MPLPGARGKKELVSALSDSFIVFKSGSASPDNTTLVEALVLSSPEIPYKA
jgi:hypothetical protein